MDRYKLPLLFLIGLFAGFALSPAGLDHCAIGQNPVKPDANGESEPPAERVFLPPDRSLRQLLDRAEQLLAQQRFSEAVQALNSVLNATEDYFYRPENQAGRNAGQTYRSLKNEARRLIGQLPPGGKRSYDLQFGAQARQRLSDAIARGDMEAVAEVTRRFCHTAASDEALILLGRYHLDQGRPLAAALCLEQVERSPGASSFEPGLSLFLAVCWARTGQPEKASEMLGQVNKRWPDARVPLAGHPQGVAISSRPVEQWITAFAAESTPARAPDEMEWTLFLGNATRTASAAGDRPLLLRPCWRQRVAFEASVEAAIAGRARQMFDQSVPAVPALYPLAAGDFVLMRAAGRLAAVNIDSGKLVWQNDATDSSSGSRLAELDQDQSDVHESAASQVTPERVWNDKTAGTISSDGELVFAIEDQDSGSSGRGVVIDPLLRRRSSIASDGGNNLLAAYQIADGKRRWWVGGPTGVEPKLEQALFLGPPLPLQGRLYVVAEMAGEVRLVVLASETGRMQWSQQLAVADDEVARDLARYGAGISPSLADGVLVCPTTAGAIVAIDLTTRSLLWGYQYPRDAATETVRDPFAPFIRIRRSSGIVSESVDAGWRDSCPMLSSGQVIVTPGESTQLHCLSLKDGQVQWKLDRQNYIYAAGVHGDKVILVGQDAVTAIALTGSKRGQAVATVPLPEGALPNGRGCYTGHDYYLPLVTSTGAEIARIDLEQFKVAERVPCRDGTAPGNLISYRGRIFSQGSDWLQCYHQLGGLKRQVDAVLADKPDDPAALTLRAQILFEQHSHAEALPLLRRAYATYTQWAEMPAAVGAAPDRSRRQEALAERTAVRELLVDGLLEYLKTHFDARDAVGRELVGLIDQPEERIRFLRIVTDGLARAEDWDGAVARCFQLLELAGDGAQLVTVDPAQTVRLDRWLAARFNMLDAKLKPESKAQFDGRVSEQLAKTETKDAEAALRLHLALFGGHPSAATARLRLATLREQPESQLERIGWLKDVAETGDEPQRREATARLGMLLLEAQRTEEAAVYYDRLLRLWSNVACLGGRTGRQLFDALPIGSPLRKAKSVSMGWPHGAVKVSQGNTDSRYPGFGYQPASELVIAGETAGPPVRVFLDVQQQLLSGLDALGQSRWRVPLARDTDGNPLMVNRGLATGRFDGHVLILSLGSHVMAINTLKASGSRGDGVLWMDECGITLREPGPEPARTPARPWQDDSPLERSFAQTLAQLGPVVAGGATYLRSRELVSVDPLTGKRFWTRRDVVPGSDLFGDNEMLLAAAPNSTDALVIQSIDGTLLGRRKVPPAADRYTTLGRQIVCVANDPAGNAVKLQLFDPWTQQTVWQIPLSNGAKLARVDATTVAVMDRQGRLTVLNLSTGKAIFEQQLESEPQLASLQVVASRDCLVVIANRPQPAKAEGLMIEPAHENGGPIVNGRVYAIDRQTGQPLWQVPATIENYALVLEQPVEIPVVVFAQRSTDRNNGAQRTSFMFLDKRTGALAAPNREYARRITNFEIVGDEDKKAVLIHLRSTANTLTLTYTNDPAPPEPPIQTAGRGEGQERSLRETLGNAMRSLGKAAKQLGKPPADKQQQEKDLFGE